MPTPPWKPRTLAAQALGAEEPVTKAVVPPVHVATTFVRDPDNMYRSGYAYARPDNATVRQAEAVIAALEGAQRRAAVRFRHGRRDGVVLALDPPAHIVASQVMYWAFRDWLTGAGATFRLRYRTRRHDRPRRGRAARCSRPDDELVWIETPANPLWTVTDIAGRRRDRAGAPARRSASIPRWRRRSSPGRSRSAPISSCIRRRNISTAIPTSSPARSRRRRLTTLWERMPRCARSTARSSVRSRRGCSCAACARSMCG